MPLCAYPKTLRICQSLLHAFIPMFRFIAVLKYDIIHVYSIFLDHARRALPKNLSVLVLAWMIRPPRSSLGHELSYDPRSYEDLHRICLHSTSCSSSSASDLIQVILSPLEPKQQILISSDHITLSHF
jgi:hypothetical protein